MKITLRPLANTDLATTYARTLEEGKVRHYHVPMNEQVVNDTDPLEIIKSHILKEEPGAEIEVLPRTAQPMSLTVDPVKNFFTNHPQVYRDLDQLHVKSVIHQYSVLISTPTALQMLITKVTSLINKVAYKINAFFARNSSDNPFREAEPNLINKIVDLIPVIPRLPEYHPVQERRIGLVHYLTVGYTEGFEEKAKELLLKDLKNLSDLGLIMGNLSMPSVMLLADTYGDGLRRGVMFAFPIINLHRAANLVGINVKDLPRGTALKQLFGIQTDTLEGGVNIVPELNPRPEIEEVTLTPKYDEDMKLYAEAVARMKPTKKDQVNH